jgi:hypothetical protein
MKLFLCQCCGQLLYFENRQCQQCLHRLGYLPEAGTLSAVEQDDRVWRALARPAGRYRFCANASYDACNWLFPADSPESFCVACRHNRTIPDLAVRDNLTRWRKFELAKHRLFYTLIRLGLPLPSRAEDPRCGLVFDFLADAPDSAGHKVMTGHEDGLIAVNLVEADDAEREKLRLAMGETYRTLLGHLRHESGHYFWDRLVRDAGRLEAFRKCFGDERQDYGQSLEAHYANGPAQDWQQRYISGYASAHPWEDFAETWAHYLHIVDTLEMAFAFGIRIRPGIERESDEDSVPNVAPDFDPHDSVSLTRLIDTWLPLTFAVNSIIRCMGESDFYPFVLSPQAVAKIGFIHELVHQSHGLLTKE